MPAYSALTPRRHLRSIAFVLLAAGIVATGFPAFAKSKPTDEPIAPKAVPVPAVNAAPLTPPNATITQGKLIAVDGDTLMIGNQIVRIYGIAAPDIHATYGAEARLALDELIAQQRVDCDELDQTKDNIIVAACKIGSDDLGEHILLSGYAATYRSQANPTPAEMALSDRYAIAEAKAREQRLGIWATVAKPMSPPAEAPTVDAAPKSVAQSWIDRAMIDQQMMKSWITAAPILLIGLIALALFSRSISRQWRQDREQGRLSAVSLLAQILAEVLAIREVANEQIDGLNHLPQDRPVPAGQLAVMGLPPALIYAANAGQLYRLPRDTGVDLVQFYAAHAGIAQMLRQALHLRADSLRTAYVKIVEAADLVLERGQKQLD